MGSHTAMGRGENQLLAVYRKLQILSEKGELTLRKSDGFYLLKLETPSGEYYASRFFLCDCVDEIIHKQNKEEK